MSSEAQEQAYVEYMMQCGIVSELARQLRVARKERDRLGGLMVRATLAAMEQRAKDRGDNAAEDAEKAT